MESDQQIFLLDAKNLPAKTVIVYGDRAEVKRSIELEISRAGKFTIIVQVNE
jgi:hypothetical protein